MPRLTIHYRLVPLQATEGKDDVSGRLFCGAGAGRHGVDQVSIRDGQGMPYIPGSTFKGVVREKFIELCRASGLSVERRKDAKGQPTHLHANRLVDSIFGAPACSDLVSVFTDLALEAEAPVAIAQVQKRVRMDRRLGRVADKSLFDVEYNSCGAFRGKIWLWRDKAPAEDPGLGLLLGALRLVRSIGGHRSTGAGLCRIELLEGRWGKEALGAEAWRESMQQLAAL